MAFQIRIFFVSFLLLGAVFGAAAALVFIVWYPSPLGRLVGADQLFGTFVVVGFFLGPTLTAALWSPSKKSFSFDAAVLVVLNGAAFLYGLFVLAQGRPAWIVFNVDRFYLVQAFEHDLVAPELISKEYLNLSWNGPVWVAAKMPEDRNERNRLLFESVFAGIDLPQRADLYQKLDVFSEDIGSKAKPLSDLRKYNSPIDVDDVLAKYPAADGYLPLVTARHDAVVLLRKRDGAIASVVDLRPWN